MKTKKRPEMCSRLHAIYNCFGTICSFLVAVDKQIVTWRTHKRTKMIELGDSSLEKLKCFKCESYLSVSPIMLKINGQNICGRCNPEDDKPSNAVRNRAYEEIASFVLFPCKYRASGCTKSLQFNNVESHEDTCEYKTFDCPVAPIGTCNWNGANSELLEHYTEEHPHLIMDHPCKISPEMNEDCEENYLLTCFGFLFLIQIKLNSSLSKLWACVRYLGNSAYISNFEYSLEVRNYQALLKKYKKVSTRENLIMNRNNCIEVNLKTMTDFFGGNENITFNICVKKKGNVCFKCKRDLKPMKLYCFGEGFHCDNCRDDSTDYDLNTKSVRRN